MTTPISSEPSSISTPQPLAFKEGQVWRAVLQNIPKGFRTLCVEHLEPWLGDAEIGLVAIEELADYPQVIHVYGITDAIATWATDSLNALLQAVGQPNQAWVSIARCECVEEKDWADAWKQFWHVTPVSPTLTIQPSWLSYTPKREDELIIQLDPGAAFGTGTHATTQLVARMLEELASKISLSQCSVLDIGCGSGILSIIAIKLGASQCVSLDIDPNAIEATQENATVNGVAHAIHASCTPLEELCLTPHEVILMNITLPVIRLLFTHAVDRLASGGMILLSGIVDHQEAALRECITRHGLTVEKVLSQGEWRGVLASKP